MDELIKIRNFYLYMHVTWFGVQRGKNVLYDVQYVVMSVSYEG